MCIFDNSVHDRNGVFFAFVISTISATVVVMALYLSKSDYIIGYGVTFSCL